MYTLHISGQKNTKTTEGQNADCIRRLIKFPSLQVAVLLSSNLVLFSTNFTDSVLRFSKVFLKADTLIQSDL